MDDLFRNLRQHEEMIRQLNETPLRYLQENAAAMARLRELAQGLDTSRLLQGIDTSAIANVTAAMDLKKFLPDLSGIAELTKTMFDGLAAPESLRAMQIFAEQHCEISAAFERLAIPHKSLGEHLRSMSSCIDATNFAVATIDWDRVGGLLSVGEAAREEVAQLSEALSFRHADLIASLTVPEGRLASVPPFVSELPTLDVFVHTGAVRSITPHDALDAHEEQTALSLRVEIATETGAFLEATLFELKPAFLDQYRGAKMRITERGPDWWTQGGSSMRKLLKGVLHTAAPNELVLPWAQQKNKALDRNGRPTRATKIEWLCQFIPNDAYRAFVREELNSALALIELIDMTQHVDDFPEFEQQYNWTMLRAEVAVRHILTIWKTGGNADLLL